eukprot:scaffold1195_cov35-Phaeocystis_antarctica.AAC.3
MSSPPRTTATRHRRDTRDTHAASHTTARNIPPAEPRSESESQVHGPQRVQCHRARSARSSPPKRGCRDGSWPCHSSSLAPLATLLIAWTFLHRRGQGLTACRSQVLGAAHRCSRRIAREGVRRARERPARRPLPSTSAPAVDHAAALWQLCCRIGRTTTVACQRVGSYARCHHLRPRATGSILGTNSRATQRAGELAAADPAYRARLARRLQLVACSRPEKLPRAAPFGVELERAIAHGGLRGRGVVRCAVRRLCDAQTTTPSANSRRARTPARCEK